MASFPTSYIPTTTSTVTRAADVASISGSNFSSWYRQDEGTVFSESTRTALDSTTIIGLSDGTLNNRISIRHDTNGNTVTGINVTGGALEVSIFGNATSKSTKAALAFAPDDYAIAGNGALGGTDTSASVPTCNTLNIGSVANAGIYNGHISRLTYWPARLPNKTLSTITQ